MSMLVYNYTSQRRACIVYLTLAGERERAIGVASCVWRVVITSRELWGISAVKRGHVGMGPDRRAGLQSLSITCLHGA